MFLVEHLSNVDLLIFFHSASLKHACPEGVYLTMASGDPALWTGILFVRRGSLHLSVTFIGSYHDVVQSHN